MIEIMIERWTNAEGETDFRWSVWDEGHPIQMGENVHSRADDCEAQAAEFSWRKLGRKPDRVPGSKWLPVVQDGACHGVQTLVERPAKLAQAQRVKPSCRGRPGSDGRRNRRYA